MSKIQNLNQHDNKWQVSTIESLLIFYFLIFSIINHHTTIVDISLILSLLMSYCVGEDRLFRVNYPLFPAFIPFWRGVNEKEYVPMQLSALGSEFGCDWISLYSCVCVLSTYSFAQSIRACYHFLRPYFLQRRISTRTFALWNTMYIYYYMLKSYAAILWCAVNESNMFVIISR